MQRLAFLVIVTVMVIAATALASFPARALMDQRGAQADADRRMTELDARIGDLEGRVDDLSEGDGLELLARERYGRVMPGEEAYRVLPAEPAPLYVPNGWPLGSRGG